MFINLHTHHPTLSPGILEVESVYFGQGKTPVAPLRSVGLHPWYLEGIGLEVAKSWLNEQAALPATIAIGESGLDKVCQTPWDLQVLAFQHCVEFSESAGKPLIIHCVRAFSEIIALKKDWKPRQTWIFHGFDKNIQTAARVLRAGCCLSFGAALFRENSHAAESLRATPADRFFLETDDAGISIKAIYERAAFLRGVELRELEEMVKGNLERVFEIGTDL
ncbi:MAG: TatD family hydrolase [Phycisphaerae bacterium]|nr:TatD family hydrolase [Saprospiraceae bacterium]